GPPCPVGRRRRVGSRRCRRGILPEIAGSIQGTPPRRRALARKAPDRLDAIRRPRGEGLSSTHDLAKLRRGFWGGGVRFGWILLGLLCASPARGQHPPNFTVYFDLGSAQPSRDARVIIDRAAEAAKKHQGEGRFDHLKVVGYADTSGSAGRSQSLSE